MKVYIGGSFTSQKRLRSHADTLWGLGHEIVSSWLGEVPQPPFMDQPTFYRKLAAKDLQELSSADLAIIDTIERSSTGGSDSEFGYALGQHTRKLVWVVGPCRSVFHPLADRVFPSWEECLNALYQAKG